VFGAWYLGSRWLKKPQEQAKSGYLALVTLTAPGSGEPVAAALVVKDAADGATGLYVIPKELLLEGPHGEYVFAGDALAAGTLKQDLQRVVDARIDAQYQLPLTALGDLTAAGEFQLSLPDPAELDQAGTKRTFADRAIVSASEVPALFAASGPSGYDAARMQGALWKAVLDAAALRPGDVRARAARAAAGRASGSADTWYLDDALRGLTGGASWWPASRRTLGWPRVSSPSSPRPTTSWPRSRARRRVFAAATRSSCATAAGAWASARPSRSGWPYST